MIKLSKHYYEVHERSLFPNFTPLGSRECSKLVEVSCVHFRLRSSRKEALEIGQGFVNLRRCCGSSQNMRTQKVLSKEPIGEI